MRAVLILPAINSFIISLGFSFYVFFAPRRMVNLSTLQLLLQSDFTAVTFLRALKVLRGAIPPFFFFSGSLLHAKGIYDSYELTHCASP